MHRRAGTWNLLVLVLFFAGLAAWLMRPEVVRTPVAPFERGPISSARPLLLPRSPSGQPAALIDLEGEPARSPEVVLPEGARRILLVRDEQDRSVSAAFAYPAGTQPRRWSESDAEGRLALPADAQLPARIDVVAPRFRRRRVELAAGRPGPQLVVLKPATVLDVRLEFVTDPEPADLSVVASSSGLLFEDEGPEFDTTLRGLLGYSTERNLFGPAGRRSGGLVSLGAGLYEHVDLRAGVPMTLHVLGGAGEELVTHEFTLRPREHRVVTIPLDITVRSLEGFVMDPSGSPLSDAEVMLWPFSGREGYCWSESTDAHGRYRIAEVLSRQVALLVAVPGFERYELETLDLAACRGVHDVRLQPEGRLPFELRVQEEGSGRPVHDVRVELKWKDFDNCCYEPDEPGRWILRDLPPGRVEVFVRAGEKEHVVVREPGQTQGLLRVPDMGSLRLAIPFELPESSWLSLDFRVPGAAPDAEAAFHRSIGLRAWQARSDTLHDLREIPVGSHELVLRDRKNHLDRPVLGRGRCTIRAGETAHAALVEAALPPPVSAPPRQADG